MIHLCRGDYGLIRGSVAQEHTLAISIGMLPACSCCDHSEDVVGFVMGGGGSCLGANCSVRCQQGNGAHPNLGAACSGGHGECLLLRGLSHAITSLNLCKRIIALGWMSAVSWDMVNGSKSSDRCKSWNKERETSSKNRRSGRNGIQV